MYWGLCRQSDKIIKMLRHNIKITLYLKFLIFIGGGKVQEFPT